MESILQKKMDLYRAQLEERSGKNSNQTALALYKLGRIYEKGLGVQKSELSAADFFKQSAFAKNVGNRNKGLKKLERNENLEKLTTQGNAELHYELGLKSEENGNWKFAFIQYQKAAVQGHPQAQARLGKMYYLEKHPDFINLNRLSLLTSAYEWATKAAEQGDGLGYSILASMHEKGETVEINQEKAFTYYQKSAHAGDSNGQYSLGRMYQKGEVVAKDDQIAFELFKKAAKQGHVDAMFYLGECLSTGVGTPQSVEKACVYYQVAAFKGHSEAKKQLWHFSSNLEEYVKNN